MDLIGDILKQAISLLLSLGLLGFLAFICREYIKRYIDYVFKAKESKVTYNQTADVEIFKSFISIFAEIAELVYKMRNYARDIIERKSPLSPARELYSESCYLFTERLYKYRAFLDRDIFTFLHQFKRINQDFVLLLDVSDRSEQLRENEAKFSNEHLRKLEFLFCDIDRLYGEITKALQAKMHVEKE